MTMKLVTYVVRPFDQSCCQELCDSEARSQNYEKRLLASSSVSVRPSVCPRGTTRFPLDGTSGNLIFEDFLKTCLEKLSFLQI
jgi:hypothetical protein